MKRIPIRRPAALLVSGASVMLLAACPPPPGGSCFVGQQVTIPTADGSDPTLVVDFHLANGGLVTVQTGGQVPAEIVSPNGTVSVVAKAQDPEGVRDVQLWIASRKCTTDPASGTTSCSGPGLLGAPTSSNRDSGVAGGTGCTERLVSENLAVLRNQVRDDSYEVTIRGENFGGGTVQIGLIRVRGQ